MTLLASPGAEIAAGWGLGLPAAISIVLSAIVVAVLARGCVGSSRAAFGAATLLWASNAALACASDPVAFVAFWQWQWFLAW
ncbi:MAG TPA: hypothetical protein VM510_11575, partial [Caulifigura sp.]|nr:hypothetical protein [Caulifigura sp.]